MNVLTGVAFTVIAWKVARRWLTPLLAALVIAFVIAPIVTLGSGYSGMLLLICIMCAIGLKNGSLHKRWQPALIIILAFFGGLAILTKFSNGILAAATVVLIAVLSSEGSVLRRALSVITVLAIIVVSTGIFWVAASQPLTNIGAWAAASLQLTSGYSEAMSTDSSAGVAQDIGFVALIALLLAQLVAYRGGRRVTLAILLAWVALVALRLGFTRHDGGHAAQAFMIILVASLALGMMRVRWLAVVGVLVAAGAVLSGWGVSYFPLIDPTTVANNTTAAVNALLSPSYRAQMLANTRSQGINYYSLTTQEVDTLRGKSVHIDPQDANVAWAYDFDWDPVPIFQSYSAYTPALDTINANALDSSSGPQAVLRALPSAIDYRNPIWESPKYMSALVCDFAPGVDSQSWLVLERTGNRCGHPKILATTHFVAGQTLHVPSSPSGYMVQAHFKLHNSLLNVVATEVFKPISSVTVTTNQGAFRLPRANASGPLILTLPYSAGWPARFGGSTDIRTLNVNESGSVTFTAVMVSSRR